MTRKVVFGILGGLVTVVVAFFVWVVTYPELYTSKTIGGLPRAQSRYVTMRDGVDIAIDVWFPPDMVADDEVPTLVAATRYSRGLSLARRLSIAMKAQLRLGIIDPLLPGLIELTPEASWANDAGYAVVLIDARGSAASFGDRPIEWSPDEIADYGEIVSWITAQPWSNGKVGAWGTSYPGNTAELIASTGAAGFLATAPRFSDFDPLLGVGMPGGLQADGFIQQWSDLNARFDHERTLARAVDDGFLGLKLRRAIAGHDNPNIAEAFGTLEYRDDEYAESGLAFETVSPYALRDAIEASGVPMQIWVSWLDAATADGALSRFLTLDNPQEVIIGPWLHGGSASIDPFRYEHVPATDISSYARNMEILKPQMGEVLRFFDRYLKDSVAPQFESRVTYYTLNSGEWRTTTVWPPEGSSTQRWHFSQGHTLSQDAPTNETGTDTYAVDFSATTGTANRWFAQSGADVDYSGDRAGEDEKLLTYTSAPLSADTEITGSPIVTLYVASTEEDGAFHVYLEDVAPDGAVTYITEGILRAIHHPISRDQPPYVHLGSYRSFDRDDAAPLIPGEVTEITLNLYATSVLIREGHRIRIAIAGADADTFRRYPAEGTPTWTVHRNSMYPSYVELPIVE